MAPKWCHRQLCWRHHLFFATKALVQKRYAKQNNVRDDGHLEADARANRNKIRLSHFSQVCVEALENAPPGSDCR
jgi:hypothetical protein